MKIKRLGFWLLLICGIWLGWATTLTAQASTQRVLIVYDAINPTVNGQKKLDGLQRLFTSIGLKAQTERLSDYYAGQLTTKKYQGVVTLVNWPQGHLTNAAFVKDRQAFTGTQLHVGQSLSQTEADALHSKRHQLYHQQFSLYDGTQHQLLPFSDDITILTATGSGVQTVGQLTTQAPVQHKYAYGTIRGQYGYLPNFSASGFSFVVASRMVAQLFHQTTSNRPLLTITGVTPYTDLKQLTRVSHALKRANIPFAVSTTSTAENTTMHAFQTFTASLRQVELDGGVVFLQAPYVGTANAQSGNTLDQTMVAQLNQLGQRQVFPVGISASNFWNQDEILRRYGLQHANHVILLPDPTTTTFAKQDNLGTTFTSAHYGLSLASLQSVKNGQEVTQADLRFAMPTAITVALPDSSKGVTAMLKRITNTSLTWENPATSWQTQIDSASASFQYRLGQYYLNGRQVTVKTKASGVPRYQPKVKTKVLLSRFFQLQGWVLFGFFTVTTIVLVIFLVLGRTSLSTNVYAKVGGFYELVRCLSFYRHLGDLGNSSRQSYFDDGGLLALFKISADANATVASSGTIRVHHGPRA
ncbi:hypothetical protein [Lactiplantibacillus herbarum]|uniref:hypothetical protein n=1 Tax=Lactiplantibacillus herbarum TaxID=1670446 RepID=UPI000A3DB247|nr:hypothetical protein [Lactiplantibacillus herbarum]